MAGRRWRREVFGAGILVAMVSLAAGAVLGYRGYVQTAGPAGAVRGYFAALARSDAAGALAFGAVPDGPHTLLTSDVLREQQRIAPLREFSVTSTRQSGDRARVSVHYLLDFPNDPQQISAVVPVRNSGGGWRLVGSAIPTELRLSQAQQRATIRGAAVPAGRLLLFPGAAPIRLDSPFLQLRPARASVRFGADPSTEVAVEVSDAGRRAARGAVRAAVQACLSGRGDRTCPQPSERYVPGSLRGTADSAVPALSVRVDNSPAGVLDVSGKVAVTGTYRRLSFENRAVAGKGTFALPVRASAYAVAPLRIAWRRA